MNVTRTEQIWLKPDEDLSRLCHLSKNLSNEGNYLIRQELFTNGKWIRYNEMYHLLKTSENYRQLPAQTAQQVLKLLDRSWKSFFRAIKEWKKDKSKFKVRPKPPSYKSKNGEFILVFTNQQIKLRDKILLFPKKVKIQIKTRLSDDTVLREVRIIPKRIGYVLEIVYKKDISLKQLNENNIASIDLGVRNLVTIVNNIGEESFLQNNINICLHTSQNCFVTHSTV